MGPSEKDDGYIVTLAIPDITRLADEELAALAPFRDGRWSTQTKALLAQFSATKLDLNRGWASTREHWTCPCCQRGKAHIARVSSGGVLLCRLEYHHDHLVDRAKRIFQSTGLATRIGRPSSRLVELRMRSCSLLSVSNRR